MTPVNRFRWDAHTRNLPRLAALDLRRMPRPDKVFVCRPANSGAILGMPDGSNLIAVGMDDVAEAIDSAQAKKMSGLIPVGRIIPDAVNQHFVLLLEHRLIR